MTKSHLILATIATQVGFAGLSLADPGSAYLVNSTYLTAANSGTVNPQRLTIEAIMRPTGPGYGGVFDSFGSTIVSKPRQNTSGSSLSAWGLYWSPISQKVVGGIGHVAGSSGTIVFSSTTVPVGTAAHVAMTFDGTTVRLYINGVLDASVVAASPNIFNVPSDPILIGASNFSSSFARRFQGEIDNVRLWNSAKSAAEIAADMTCLPSGPQSGLIGSWNFDQGGATASDVSDHGMTATWVGTSIYHWDYGTPAIPATQPIDRVLCPGASASVTCVGLGTGGVTHQWQAADADAPGGWKNLTNGIFTVNGQIWGTCNGVTSTLLNLVHTPGSAPLQISMRCMMTGSCGTAPSNPVFVTVCPADFNCDNVIDLFDYLDFVAAFSSNEPGSDFNADTVVDFFDYLDFVSAFASGC